MEQFAQFVQSFGTLGGLVWLAWLTYQFARRERKIVEERAKVLDSRGKTQDQRESELSGQLTQLIAISNTTAAASATMNEKVATTLEAGAKTNALVVDKLGNITTAFITNLAELSEKSGIQTQIVQAIQHDLEHPILRLTPVIDAINNPIINEVRTNSMEAQDKVLKELARIRQDISDLSHKVDTVIADVRGTGEHPAAIIPPTSSDDPPPLLESGSESSYPVPTVPPPSEVQSADGKQGEKPNDNG